MPDQIIIFQRPHEDECDSLAELKAEVTHTLRHEIAHYFGVSNAHLD
ncbi:MAG: metallopeptidase family protein [Chloroflexi bacterium]|nr:metallopeptidase family protein [Chloroflexota bacterium]